ncbi:family 1 encapsulin nanocompartment shell protein [Jiangella asiatica]|uniref:Type 1 encapsulin shell protein n=1 Tax=Jiangella asiatica TaxID=2530372 RepID=A0A4R5DSW1_9ACTN|nr:family 1 encapsulin nanocompartment shell protein [Jiangella asiatica]TDE14215.1 bacteriocin [Jiangella asiatica]
MNNLHRELAPISDTAWTRIEDEARRTFTEWIAGRRIVDLVGPTGPDLAAVGTGHLEALVDPMDGVIARQHQAQNVVELRVPFFVTRAAIDDVERGAEDSDWEPVKDAAQKIAVAEDRVVFHGFPAAGIAGITSSSGHQPLPLSPEVRKIPDSVARALSTLRLAGVGGPYSLLLSAEIYTAVSEETDHGYPILEHIARLIDSDIIWAPALQGALLVSTRGGDYTLHLGQDLSIGYLSHDAERVELYLQESLTFLTNAPESSLALTTG